MKLFVFMVITSLSGIFTPIFGQTAPAQSAAMPVPTASAAPSGTVARPQKNQNRRQRRKEIPQQQPTATIAPPAVTHRQNTGRRNVHPRPTVDYAGAIKRQHHERHDRNWWRTRYTTIVYVTGQGYYYWDWGYWFPALGYDPRYETYEYNGPIYTYGNLLPDQVIYNVQRALKDLGYYSGNLSGSMSAATINAISAFQEDSGLEATGAIDAPTVEALGLD